MPHTFMYETKGCCSILGEKRNCTERKNEIVACRSYEREGTSEIYCICLILTERNDCALSPKKKASLRAKTRVKADDKEE